MVDIVGRIFAKAKTALYRYATEPSKLVSAHSGNDRFRGLGNKGGFVI